MSEQAPPIEGRWYWVRGAGKPQEWWPALRSSNSIGGWTNEDTWEDFTYEVVAWKLIPLPEELP